jgi:hypothetical protein
LLSVGVLHQRGNEILLTVLVSGSSSRARLNPHLLKFPSQIVAEEGRKVVGRVAKLPDTIRFV